VVAHQHSWQAGWSLGEKIRIISYIPDRHNKPAKYSCLAVVSNCFNLFNHLTKLCCSHGDLVVRRAAVRTSCSTTSKSASRLVATHGLGEYHTGAVHYPMWSEQNPGHFVALSQHIGCQDVASDAGQQGERRSGNVQTTLVFNLRLLTDICRNTSPPLLLLRRGLPWPAISLFISPACFCAAELMLLFYLCYSLSVRRIFS